jgi:hypothetical protein
VGRAGAARLALGVVVALVVPGGGCADRLTSTSGQQCRKYATVLTYGPESASTGTCALGGESGPDTYECRIDCTLTVREYAGLRDFIEEARVPNRSLLLKESVTSTCVGLGGASGYVARSYVYDEQRRLVRIEAAGRVGYDPASWPPTQFTAWDGAGRPVAGTDTFLGARREFTIVYDDAARTMEWSYGYSVEQDAFGNTVRRGDSVYRVVQMAEVCQ